MGVCVLLNNYVKPQQIKDISINKNQTKNLTSNQPGMSPSHLPPEPKGAKEMCACSAQ